MIEVFHIHLVLIKFLNSLRSMIWTSSAEPIRLSKMDMSFSLAANS